VNDRAFPRFVLAGGIAALANMGSRIALGSVMDYVPSIVAAYLIGMLTAFLLNRHFVFQRAGNALGQQVLWFTIVNLAALAQTLAVSVGLSRWLLPWIGWPWHPETTAHVIGVMVPVFTSYLGHKHLTFRA
jgi:putative flippase GtrA